MPRNQALPEPVRRRSPARAALQDPCDRGTLMKPAGGGRIGEVRDFDHLLQTLVDTLIEDVVVVS
jgi:hypothetical protein